MPATKSKPSGASRTAPKNNNVLDNIKVACPIYIGINAETCKQILESIRNQCGVVARTNSFSSIKVEESGISQAQHDIERQLKVDIKTLRMLLFDSWNRGLNLDLALRLQEVVKDDVQFITRDDVNEGIQLSLDHYDYFSQIHA